MTQKQVIVITLKEYLAEDGAEDGRGCRAAALKYIEELEAELLRLDSIRIPCDEPRCTERATRGTPVKDGYRHTCNRHIPPESERR